jgi:phospholipid transport system transporter-binding protein
MLTLPVAAGLEEAPALLQQVDAAIAATASGDTLALDAAALVDFDTSAVALLLHACRGAQARGVRLQVQGAPPKLRELARLYGVEELLPLADAPADTPADAATGT